MSSLFEQNFIKYLKREYNDFGIDWDLVDIKSMDQTTLMADLPSCFDDYLIRIRVLRDKFISKDINKWTRTQKFIFWSWAIGDETAIIDILCAQDIALKIRRIFRENKKGIFSE